MARWHALVGSLSLLGSLSVAPAALAEEAPSKIDVSTPAPEPAVERSYHVHDGFYLRMSIGLGGMDVHYDPEPSDGSAAGGGLAFDLLIGGSPSRGMAIGAAIIDDIGRSLTLEADGREVGDIHATSVLVGPFIDGFPNPKGGWHLGGMVGFATQQFDAPRANDVQSTTGVGGAAWGGYDAWVGDEWSVGGLGRIAAAVTRGEDAGVDIKASNLSFMLAFSALYH